MIVILGAGESGIGAALLAKKKGLIAFVSDQGTIKPSFQKELVDNEIDFESEGHHIIFDFVPEYVVKSPGIPDHSDIVKFYQHKGIKIISEVEFAYQFVNGIIIAITGSNGKTTTTNLSYHLLNQAGRNVIKCGNVGYSFARAVSQQDWEIYVLELSSFQLDGIDQFRPNIAVLLNITPDHLDRYNNSLDEYAASKFRIFENQKSEDYAIYYSKDSVIQSKLKTFHINASSIEVDPLLSTIGTLSDHQETLANLSTTVLRGKHNAINATCSIRAVQLLDLEPDKIQAGLNSFVNDPHRLELIAEVNQIKFINDSKATNVDSVFYALDSIERDIVWIVGGLDKGNDYSVILPLVKERVKSIIALGKDNTKLISYFSKTGIPIADTHSMEDAVQKSFELAAFQDTVLLSPACASFDLFQNYEHRGNCFKEEVLKRLNK